MKKDQYCIYWVKFDNFMIKQIGSLHIESDEVWSNWDTIKVGGWLAIEHGWLVGEGTSEDNKVLEWFVGKFAGESDTIEIRCWETVEHGWLVGKSTSEDNKVLETVMVISSSASIAWAIDNFTFVFSIDSDVTAASVVAASSVSEVHEVGVGAHSVCIFYFNII